VKQSLVTTQFNHSKVETISLMPKDTTSKLAGLPSHHRFFMLNVKQRSCNTTFKVFWPDSAREPNPGLPTFSTKITKDYCSNDFKRTFQLKTWSIG